MDDITDIREMYNLAWDSEDNRLQRHQLEHDITWRYLEKYLPPSGANLLEIGCATGQYTIELARRGYKVLAFDLSPDMVAGAKARTAEAGFSSLVSFRAGDIRTITDLPVSSFDAILLMGPMYHLVQRDDRLLALNQVYQSLKPGGVLFSTWITVWHLSVSLSRHLAHFALRIGSTLFTLALSMWNAGEIPTGTEVKTAASAATSRKSMKSPRSTQKLVSALSNWQELNRPFLPTMPAIIASLARAGNYGWICYLN